jgi:hypothetical protein
VIGFVLLLTVEAVLLWSKWPFTKGTYDRQSGASDREQAAGDAISNDIFPVPDVCSTRLRLSATGRRPRWLACAN